MQGCRKGSTKPLNALTQFKDLYYIRKFTGFELGSRSRDRDQISKVKVAQINYVSRNQLHCTENLNFGLMYKKAKHCWALSTNFLFLCS